MKVLLISDANILIDLEEGKLIDTVFGLPYIFSTPDIIFFEELEEQHPDLPRLGLKLGSLTPESVSRLEGVAAVYTKPSRNDCMALVLAIQEQCPLLTGDKELRKTAKKENVEVYGTIWLIEEMVKNKIISIEDAKVSYRLMEENGRRLPFTKALRRLSQL